MPKMPVYNMEGKEIKQIDISDEVFGMEPNKGVLHSAVVAHLANKRQGTQSTLTRSEVSGGGKKPWRQKGTGHARQGSTRSPQWVHGGVALGPKPRDYSKKLNKKVKRIAVKSALSAKCAGKELVIVDNISVDSYKTKRVVEFLNNLGADKKTLIILGEIDQKVIKSGSNIKELKISQVGELNAYDILNNEKTIIPESAVRKIEEVYA